MAEYIEREAAIIELYGMGVASGMDIALNRVKSVPAADVAPVRHGRWVMKHRHHGGFRRYTGVDDYGEQHTITVDERIELDEPYCQFCGKWNESLYLNYCPNCGAKMDGAE